jgi:hypothetical protein
MTEFLHKPCCFCGKPIKYVKNGYYVIWGDEDEPDFAHNDCAKNANNTRPMSGEEIAKAMRPTLEAAYESLKKMFMRH